MRKKFRDSDDDEEFILKEPKNKALIERKRQRKQENKNKSNIGDLIEQITSRYKDLNSETFAANKFSDFPLSPLTLRGLKDSNFTSPTDIQLLSLKHSIIGKDVVGAAKTGSGKTLALLIPLLECLWRNKWTKFDGLGAIVITPTRELAFQIFQVLNNIGSYHDFSAALLIGGTDVDFERERLSGISIVICTPGRLLQHMDENGYFCFDQLQMLVIDEADRILDMGFKQQIDAIIENLPKQRQTLLFSATQTKRVEDLIRVSLKDPVFVSAHEGAKNSTPDQLTQSYLVCEEEDKINIVWSFLRNHQRKKTLIFVTSCKQARFLTEAITHLRPGLFFTGLWGSLKQGKRMERFQRFDEITNKGAAMICTDIASRGLDFAGLDWVLQMDCPPSVDDYIHRVGRTARMNKSGEAMLILTGSQEGPFVEMLKARQIPINKVEIEKQKLFSIQTKLANLMIPFPELKHFAQSAFVAYARAVYFAQLKTVFNVDSINFEALAKSYGLPLTPRIRFLRKRGVNIGDSDKKKTTTKTITVTDEIRLGGDNSTNAFDVDGEQEKDEKDVGDEFLKITRRDVFNEVSEVNPEEEILARISSKKAITKTQLASKMLRRLGNAGITKRKRFADSDEDD
ncbi:hypothetical protein ACQ4LE_000729 [Meloidogyne hapla]